MKKILFTTLVIVSLISSAFALPVKTVNYSVANAFKGNFPTVKNVQWDVTAEYAKATFLNNNVVTEAFYQLDGEFIGSSHGITLDQLPVYAKRSFAKKYADLTVKEAIQFESKDETAYFISAESAKQSLVLKVVNGVLSVYKISDKK